MKRRILATCLLGFVLITTVGATGEPALPPMSDEQQLAFSLSIEGCVGVVQVLKRTVDSGSDGDYTEFLDVKPMRWFTGTCGTAKMHLYSRPHSSFGFLSTGDWEVGPPDTVIVFTYRDKKKTYVSQTPHTLWNGLAKATPEKIQFLEANVAHILDSLSAIRRGTKR